MLNFSDKQLSAYFTPSSWQKGQQYHRARKVLSLDVSTHANSLQVQAQVIGTARKPYQVKTHIHLKSDKATGILGRCSCPMSINCKHVAATVRAFMALDFSTSQYDTLRPPSHPIVSDVPHQWSAWLTQQLKPTTRPQTIVKPEHVIYRLYLQKYEGRWQLKAAIKLARLLKKGGYGKAVAFSPTAMSHLKALQPADYAICQQGLQSSYPSSDITVSDEALLLKLIETGRSFWENQLKPLQSELPQAVSFGWQLRKDGEQVYAAEDHDIIALPLSPPWIINTRNATCSRLLIELPEAAFLALLSAPPVPLLQFDAALSHLQRLAKIHRCTLPLPQPLTVLRPLAYTPQPILKLIGASPLRDRSYGTWSLAELLFQYGDVRIPIQSHDVCYVPSTATCFNTIQRDRALEKAWVDNLSAFHLQPLVDYLHRQYIHPDYQAHLLLATPEAAEAEVLAKLTSLDLLRQQGWIVEIDASFPVKPMKSVDSWYTDVHAENDWFTLELGVTIEGKKVNLLPLLVEALHKKGALEDYPLRLPEGCLVNVPKERLAKLLETLTELYNPQSLTPEQLLAFKRVQAPRLFELEEQLGIAVKPPQALRRFAEQLQTCQGIMTAPLPQHFQGELRPYQQQGLNWLQFLREYQLGGLLADDMGLGKTIQTLAHLSLEKEAGRLKSPALIIAPTSLVANWCLEAERFAPTLTVLPLQGAERAQHFEQIAQSDIVISTYPLLLRDHAQLLIPTYHVLIIDEAQFIKNPKSQVSQLIRQIQAHHRIALTGTPMENHLGELWSLFDVLIPGLLGSQKLFTRVFRTPIEKQQNTERRLQLAKRITPFILRRTKDAVLQELPLKTEIVRPIELMADQQDLYESIRIAMQDKVRKAITEKGLARSQIVVLDALLKCRQVCCDPRLVKLKSSKAVKTSAKLSYLMDILPPLLEEGRRILLFSTFTSMLKLIEQALSTQNIPYVILTGQTKDRLTPIQAFQQGEVPLFLISLKAGGTGLNLTAADTVIHYDPWWNPAAEDQATDRAYRMGQDKPVFVYKLITKGTVEEKIHQLQQRKKALVGQLLSDSANLTVQWSAQEIADLFAPLG